MTRGMIYDLATAGDMLLAGSADGLWLWQCDEWTPASLPPEAVGLPVTALATAPEGTLFAAVPGALLRSHDRGASWKLIGLPAPAPTVTVLACSPRYAQDRVVYAGTLEDGVLVSSNGGERWSAQTIGLYDHGALCLAVSPRADGSLALAVGGDSGVFRSLNGGRSWRETDFPPDLPAVLSISLSVIDGREVLLAGTDGGGVWWSADGGKTWTAWGAFADAPVNRISLSESGAQALTPEALWRAEAVGENWKPIRTTIPPHAFTTWTLDDERVWLGAADGGLTWVRFGE